MMIRERRAAPTADRQSDRVSGDVSRLGCVGAFTWIQPPDARICADEGKEEGEGVEVYVRFTI